MLDRTTLRAFEKFEWTPGRIARLKQLHADGWAYSEIGNDLGTTRNSCIGKAKRLGFTRVCERDGQPRRRKVNNRTFNFGTRKPRKQHLTLIILPDPPEPIVLPPIPNPCAIPLQELREHHCRYPEGNGPFLFCGEQKLYGKSYCAFHYRSCYQKNMRREG